MSQSKNTTKKRVAVFFGGRSPEHDVSVVSGLQALNAIDQSKYAPFPVYIAPDGEWLVGDLLRERASYMLDVNAMKQVTAVTIDVSANRKGVLIPKKTGLFGGAKPVEFDVALPVFHGLIGEDGNIQGLFELANIPYTGMRTKASSILMDKVATKHFMHALDIPYLPYAVLKRPEQGYLIPEEKLEAILKPLGYPCIVKPSHLGSSIGVAKVRDAHEAKACLPAIFEFDPVAIAEPFVENLVEYNVAVSKCFEGKTVTSAIERPKAKDELLDFKQKYLSGGGTKGAKGGTKTPRPVERGDALSDPRDQPRPAQKNRQRHPNLGRAPVRRSGRYGCTAHRFHRQRQNRAGLDERGQPVPRLAGIFSLGGRRPAASLHRLSDRADRRSLHRKPQTRSAA
ncbi:MAG: D-alanine--D-alanine ligase [Alphaproteobacteria bacterium]|nr:D-alanine--D-alanine ligase [Alphaproteobacteria bacterium]